MKHSKDQSHNANAQKIKPRKKRQSRKKSCLTDKDLDDSIRQTYEKSKEDMSKNARKQYLPKIKEYLAWCKLNFVNQKHWDFVSAPKLHRFLKDNVIDRPSKRQKGNEETEQLIQYTTIKQYKQAITKLYHWQLTEKRFTTLENPPPNSSTVKDLMEMSARNIQNRRIENYLDRGIGTLLDGYQKQDLPRIASYFFGMNDTMGMKNRTTQLLLHHNCMRWDNGRMIELPDIFLMPLEGGGTGGQVCQALVIILRQGKK